MICREVALLNTLRHVYLLQDGDFNTLLRQLRCWGNRMVVEHVSAIDCLLVKGPEVAAARR